MGIDDRTNRTINFQFAGQTIRPSHAVKSFFHYYSNIITNDRISQKCKFEIVRFYYDFID